MQAPRERILHKLKEHHRTMVGKLSQGLGLPAATVHRRKTPDRPKYVCSYAIHPPGE